jgi:hypothetical protein
MTPISGFIFSQHYFSEELAWYGQTWLNPKSRLLTSRKRLNIKENDIIYCQVDQIIEFVETFLPRINVNFILITGKEELPGLVESDALHRLTTNPYLLAWFSQNQSFQHLSLIPFPYGVRLSHAPLILEKMKRKDVQKSRGVFVPFAKIHNHLSGEARLDREFLKPFMSQETELDVYLDTIQSSAWVVSPAGDRPDTYRHWEIVALGSMVLSKLPANFTRLFGNSLLNVTVRSELIDVISVNIAHVSNPNLALMDYWRNRVQSHRK